MNVFTQEQVFIFFFVIGIIIGIVFDVFRVLRKSFKTIDIITLIEDVIFLIFTGSLIILGIIKLNAGEVRFYLFLAITFGILIYSLTISNFCVIILYEFVKICKKISKIPLICLKEVFYFAKRLRKKDF